MNKKIFLCIFTLFILIFSSCLGQRNRRNAIIPIPDTEFSDFTLPLSMEKIIETKGGRGTGNMPAWLRAYINGGIKEVEEMDEYAGKYMFVGRSEGQNFTAMGKWAENFSPARDTVMLAARRIENKAVISASLYPDDEYGEFFENIVLNAYSRVYPGAVKEDEYWIRMRIDGEDGDGELYVFFVLISVEKSGFEEVVNDMFIKSMPKSGLPENQRRAIGNLQRNFFEGF